MSDEIEVIFSNPIPDGREGVLGRDKQNRLYWNGERLAVVEKLQLTWWVNAAIVVGGFATALLGIDVLVGWLQGGM